jgi:hypothetical protein
MGPPVMGFQDPPDFDSRVGMPWLTISLFVLLAMAVAFAGGTGYGYSLGRGKAASAAPGRSDADVASETATMVQTLHSQIELYRLQHQDRYPTLAQLQDNWSVLMRATNVKGSFVIGTHGQPYGPYMQSPPVNPLNGKSNVCALGSPTANAGWGYNPARGEIKAILRPGGGFY